MGIGARVKSLFVGIFNQDVIERRKMMLLAVCFFVLLGGYTVVRELKDIVFVNIIGLESVPSAKLWCILALVPLVFFYSYLVDALRRSQLLCVCAVTYALIGIICAYFLGHPTIGLPNTHASASRVFGWFFYFFMESYQPFLISVLWSFVNSVTKPEAAKNSYAFMVAGGQVGGALMASLAWLFLSLQSNSCYSAFSCAESYQTLMLCASCMLLIVPMVMIYLVKTTPQQHLHGYEAAYKFEKKREDRGETSGVINRLKGMFDGIFELVKYPYMLGMFGMIFFWEVLNVILSYLRLGAVKEASASTFDFGIYLYQQMVIFNLIGLVIVVIGTRTLVSWIGERRSLIAVPVLIGVVITYYLTSRTLFAASAAFLLMRAINYAFASPLRETLYIPTTKALKFKTKTWIDSFGAKISKATGSCYNLVIQGVPASMIVNVHIAFFAGILILWGIMAHFLGKRFETAVKNNELIGAD
jgi:ATP:ADP antiporter, AAA family